jgi:hypothetical protein
VKIWNTLSNPGKYEKIKSCPVVSYGLELKPTGITKDNAPHFSDASLICDLNEIFSEDRFVCQKGYLNGFRLRVKNRTSYDLYNVDMMCSDGTIMKGNGINSKGNWLAWKKCPPGMYINGLEKKIDRKMGLTNLKFQCDFAFY